jgi:hypothetical protein
MTDWPLIICAVATLACFGVIFALGIAAITEHRSSDPLGRRKEAEQDAITAALWGDQHPYRRDR